MVLYLSNNHNHFLQIILACSGIFWTSEVSQAILEKDGLKVWLFTPTVLFTDLQIFIVSWNIKTHLMTTFVTCIHCRFANEENLHVLLLGFKISEAQNQANHGDKLSRKQLKMHMFLLDHPSHKKISLLATITEWNILLSQSTCHFWVAIFRTI